MYNLNQLFSLWVLDLLTYRIILSEGLEHVIHVQLMLSEVYWKLPVRNEDVVGEKVFDTVSNYIP